MFVNYMEIKYSNKSISYYDFLTPTQTKNKPTLLINNLGYKYYTLIMYDPDAVKGNYWHWVLSNITNEDTSNNTIQSKNTILDYYGPNPPDNKKHRYIFELYGHDNLFLNKPLHSRSLSLERGKNIIGLSGRPILQTIFFSQREKGGTRKKQSKKSKKRNYRKTTKLNKRNKRNN